jgi:hypothetical protein
MARPGGGRPGGTRNHRLNQSSEHVAFPLLPHDKFWGRKSWLTTGLMSSLLMRRIARRRSPTTDLSVRKWWSQATALIIRQYIWSRTLRQIVVTLSLSNQRNIPHNSYTHMFHYEAKNIKDPTTFNWHIASSSNCRALSDTIITEEWHRGDVKSFYLFWIITLRSNSKKKTAASSS